MPSDILILYYFAAAEEPHEPSVLIIQLLLDFNI